MVGTQVGAPRGGSGLTEEHWDDLLRAIRAGVCTPVVGAGACHPTLPLAGEIASGLAAECRYPLTDMTNLPRVAQYLAINRYPLFPKEKVLALLAERGYPDYAADDPHGVLASLPVSVYVTTNYDDFLEEALRRRMRDVKADFCPWNAYHEVAGTTPLLDGAYEPSVGQPLVYHLHGMSSVPQSVVLTEQDYLSFLLKANSQGAALLPPRIRIALANNALLFIGYSMTDWTFRILFRGLVEMIKANAQRPAVSIQVPPTDVLAGREGEARAYLETYHQRLQGIDVRMYWGTAQQFAGELRERWSAFS